MQCTKKSHSAFLLRFRDAFHSCLHGTCLTHRWGGTHVCYYKTAKRRVKGRQRNEKWGGTQSAAETATTIHSGGAESPEQTHNDEVGPRHHANIKNWQCSSLNGHADWGQKLRASQPARVTGNRLYNKAWAGGGRPLWKRRVAIMDGSGGVV